MKTNHLRLTEKEKSFIDNTKLYFNKVFELCKNGTTREGAYNIVESEYRDSIGKKKYVDYESFKTNYKQFWRNRNNRN